MEQAVAHPLICMRLLRLILSIARNAVYAEVLWAGSIDEKRLPFTCPRSHSHVFTPDMCRVCGTMSGSAHAFHGPL